MNVKLLRKIQKHILEEPKRYDQNVWLAEGAPQNGFATCGTMACIGGWAQILGSKRKPRAVSRVNAMRLLGIDRAQAWRLFDSIAGVPEDMWPRKFSAAYVKAKTDLGRARAAVRRIDHFIKTRGAE
jgi:hypothetical protein